MADNDRKRRAQAAAERKAKVMAQMNQMQKKFAKTHQTELASMDTNEHVSTNVDPSGLEIDKKTRYKAIGAEKSMPHVSYSSIVHLLFLSKVFLHIFRTTIKKLINMRGYFSISNLLS